MVSKLAILKPKFVFGFVCLHFVEVVYDFLFLFKCLFSQNLGIVPCLILELRLMWRNDVWDCYTAVGLCSVWAFSLLFIKLVMRQIANKPVYDREKYV